MNIQTVVIHEIKKRDGETSADTFLTHQALDSSDERIIWLISSLDKAFSGKASRRAKFSDYGFKSVIADFNNINLIESSRELTKKLKEGIQNISPSKGGYLVFCQYKTTRDFLSVFLVRNTEGAYLTSKNQTWDIQSVPHLDVKNFAMGVRINLDILNSPTDESRYIQLVRGSTDISIYFENWVGLEEKKQEAKDGEALYEIANYIELPENVSNRDHLKKLIYDYANDRPSKVVNLGELSAYLYEGDAEKIPDYCEINHIDIDSEFKLGRSQLNKFFKISVSAGGIKLEAPRSVFSQSGIRVSEDGETIIIPSRELADEINRSLYQER